MKQLIQFTKETFPKILSCIKPERPHPNACCGCDCGELCAWVPYYKALKEYEECVAESSKSKEEK
jgi:hypothetical protein